MGKGNKALTVLQRRITCSKVMYLFHYQDVLPQHVSVWPDCGAPVWSHAYAVPEQDMCIAESAIIGVSTCRNHDAYDSGGGMH